MIYSVIHLAERFPFLGKDGCDPTLEIYLPENMAEIDRQNWLRPTMLIIPGGGYRFVSRREAEPLALHLLPRGFNVCVLTYSVAPHGFPTQLREVAAAMELICEYADSWHCDREKLAIMGFSAGGHLAAHYCNRYDCPQVREVFPDSKPVAAAVLGYPVITADPRYSHKGSFEKLNGGTYPTEGEMQDFYSCEKMVTERTPPTFLWHCTGDKVVPVKNSLLYADALAERGIPFRMEIFPGGRHGLGTADLITNRELLPEAAASRDWLEALHKWLHSTLNTLY